MTTERVMSSVSATAGVGSSAPHLPRAGTPVVVSAGGAGQRLVVLSETTALPPLGSTFSETPRTLRETIDSSSGSSAGHSAVAGFLSCPEYARLRAMGVRRRAPYGQGDYGPEDLGGAPFGTMMHALRAMRFLRGVDSMLAQLEVWRSELSESDYLKARMLWSVYDAVWPLGKDPFEYLGVEVEVVSRVGVRPDGSPILRSVRYDTVIQRPGEQTVYSFECKTAARSGRGTILPYLPQGASHSALWNSNPHLVAKYGEMKGTLFDLMIKTKEPKCEREHEFFTRHQQERMKLYLSLPEDGRAQYRTDASGRSPQFFHTCYGRWDPCEYVGACWDESYGDYEVRGEIYDGK